MIMSVDRPNFRGHFPLTTKRRKRAIRKFMKWRAPQGIDRHIGEAKGPRPKIGYGHKNEDKFKHPCELREVFIRSLKDIENIKEKNVALRFSSTLGMKKKQQLLDIAKKKGLKTLN